MDGLTMVKVDSQAEHTHQRIEKLAAERGAYQCASQSM